MSSELYQVISLASRYLFVFLGVLIVFRALIWLISDRRERLSDLRRLPDAGMIGEMVVLAGSSDLPEGTVLPVPREGVLGFVRTCDLVVPCSGVRKRHLWFSFEDGKGLVIRPQSGCEALIDANPVDCHSKEPVTVMSHGSYLQVGSAMLRLRVFAGLDSAAGFETPGAADPGFYYPDVPYPVDPLPPAGSYTENLPPCIPGPMSGTPGYPVSPSFPESGTFPGSGQAEDRGPVSGPVAENDRVTAVPSRKRRSARWEDDWSE